MNQLPENAASLSTHPEEQLRDFGDQWNLDVFSKEFALKLDQSNLWPSYRDRFFYPKVKDLPKIDQKLIEDPDDECVYLCGNSLGLQPKKARECIIRELDKWAKMYLKIYFTLNYTLLFSETNLKVKIPLIKLTNFYGLRIKGYWN